MLLEQIHRPEDVQLLPKELLPQLCQEIRDVLTTTVSQNGGHLASNLGTVELTVALHRHFHSPEDKLVFDVGHQCYTHKLLTGRYEHFASLRKQGGLSGFTRPDESPHDVFLSGHSSTSVSAGLGLAVAAQLQKQSFYTVSVIGDGALTGGLAYEGLNNAGRMKNNKHIVIINDNKMSISSNVGGMARHLSAIRIRPGYSKAKSRFSHILLQIPLIGKGLHRAFFTLKTMVKNLLYHSTVFEELGFSYIGPIDGHDLNQLEQAMETAKHTRRPALIHVCTCKGKGYPFAEKTPKDYHGVSSGLDLDTGECRPSDDSFSHVFGQVLCELAESNPSVCGITAAMCDGTGMTEFSTRFPQRFFDVGIAEQHAITFASGLAKGGMIPYVAIYSSFLQRGYDQLIHDVAAQGLKVVLCVDRCGLVGEDGELHHGMLDASYLRTIPESIVYSPCSFAQLKQTLKKAMVGPNTLIAIRYPRGRQHPAVCDLSLQDDMTVISNESTHRAFVTYGRLTGACLEAASICSADVVTLNQIKPLPEKLMNALLSYKELYFFEENIESGSVSQEILASLCKVGYNGSVHSVSLGDRFISHASVEQCMEFCGLTARQMVAFVQGEGEVLRG